MVDIPPINYWDIVPFGGIGRLRFGLTQAEVRTLLGPSFEAFKRGPYTKTESDAYSELGLNLEYDTKHHLQCIEAWGSCPVYYKDVPFLNRPINDVLANLTRLGLKSRYDDGYFFDDAGFALSTSGEIVKAVTVFKRGYYDQDV